MKPLEPLAGALPPTKVPIPAPRSKSILEEDPEGEGSEGEDQGATPIEGEESSGGEDDGEEDLDASEEVGIKNDDETESEDTGGDGVEGEEDEPAIAEEPSSTDQGNVAGSQCPKRESSGSAHSEGRDDQGEEDAGSSQCWFRDGVLSCRVDPGDENLPLSTPMDFYARLLTPLLTPKYMANMDVFSFREMFLYQNQLAVHSALMTTNLFSSATDAERELCLQLAMEVEASQKVEAHA